MHEMLKRGIVTGLERISAWSDLLDGINVFPIADGDTGRNLKSSLTPLMHIDEDAGRTAHRLLMSARGNSGNIASQFFSAFITAESERDIAPATALGRERAWKAVKDPRQGTMLTVFDSLNGFYRGEKNIFHTEGTVKRIIETLDKSVRSTPRYIKKLAEAGVVDSGALGMFIFFEGFYHGLIGMEDDFIPVTERFGGLLSISAGYADPLEEDGYCIDTVLRVENGDGDALKRISETGESVVMIPGDEYVKVHLHARDGAEARRRLETLGDVVNWTSDDLAKQASGFRNRLKAGPVHVMTDAAGSISRECAQELGITLLESYITVDDRSLPETQFSPSELYMSMRSGSRASTSQASMFERHQSYSSALSRHERVLYLCVGSVFTGNWQVADQWKRDRGIGDRFTVIDTGAASGRLGLLAVIVARYASEASSPSGVLEFAARAAAACDEYIFIEKLQYLAAGGRMSKTGAFFGDMLHMKPVITPTSEGAKKVAMVRRGAEQVAFAMDRIAGVYRPEQELHVMLQYSDNEEWVTGDLRREAETRFPGIKVMIQPLSLTTGVHTGPGTWALALLPSNP